MSRTTTLVVIAAAALLPLDARAQLQIKVGASFASTTESDYVPDVKNQTGFAAGVGWGIPFGKRLDFYPELLYVQKGAKYGDDAALKIDELDLPLMLRWNLPIDVLLPYLYAGPQLEFGLNCKAAGDDCVDTNDFRWGAVLGLGVRLGGLVTLEGRYNWTFNDISDQIASKPRTILLLAGLDLGKRRGK